MRRHRDLHLPFGVGQVSLPPQVADVLPAGDADAGQFVEIQRLPRPRD